MPHTKFGLNRPGTFGGEDVFCEMLTDGHVRTDGRTDGYRTHFMRLSRRDNLTIRTVRSYFLAQYCYYYYIIIQSNRVETKSHHIEGISQSRLLTSYTQKIIPTKLD